MSTPPPAPPTQALLTLRSAFILLLAVLAGLTVGALTYLGQPEPAPAVLAGLVAAGGVSVAAHNLSG
jgi:hypothetical protein